MDENEIEHGVSFKKDIIRVHELNSLNVSDDTSFPINGCYSLYG